MSPPGPKAAVLITALAPPLPSLRTFRCSSQSRALGCAFSLAVCLLTATSTNNCLQLLLPEPLIYHGRGCLDLSRLNPRPGAFAVSLVESTSHVSAYFHNLIDIRLVSVGVSQRKLTHKVPSVLADSSDTLPLLRLRGSKERTKCP